MSNLDCVLLVTFLVFGLCSASEIAEDNSFESCLKKDSISCVQIHVYRKLRAFFGQDTINLIGGFQLVKNKEAEDERSLKYDSDLKVFGAVDVTDREVALEEFAYDKIVNFFQGRSFKWNVAPVLSQVTSTARMAIDSIPQDVRDKMTSYVNEGRGKKKILKSLIPILIAAKLKIIGFFGLVYAVVAVIAKKALVSSVLALAIILFITIKKHLSKHHVPHYHEYHAEPFHGHSWSQPMSWSSNSWDPSYNSYDIHGSHSSPHHVAYSAQKPAHR